MVFKCPNCGGEVEYLTGTSTLKCLYCDSVFTVQEFRALKQQKLQKYEAEAVREPGGYYDVHEYTCSRCGATLYSTDTTVATFCSYCGSSTVLEERIIKEKKPDQLIPFSKDKEESVRRYKRYVRSRIFAPNWLTAEAEVDRFRGIYMPYWIYSFTRRGKMPVHGKRSYMKGHYEITDRYTLSRTVEAELKGLNFDGAMSFSDSLSNGIAPFNTAEAVPFDEAYLAGFYADANDVNSSVYEEDAETIARRYVARNMPEKRKYRSYSAGEARLMRDANLKSETQSGLFPVWFLSARPKDRDKVCYGVVNGQTGKVAADVPVDFGKYLLGSLLLAVPFFLLLNRHFILTPIETLWCCICMALITLITADRQLTHIFARKAHLDDAGYLGTPSELYSSICHTRDLITRGRFGGRGCLTVLPVLFGVLFLVGMFAAGGFYALLVLIPIAGQLLLMMGLMDLVKNRTKARVSKSNYRGEKVDIPWRERIALLLKPAVSIALSLLILGLHPVMDIWYYGTAAADLVMIAWAFLDLVKGHNELTMRDLPQFEYRGGDHYE